MTIRTIVCGAYQSNAYLIDREDRDDALLIDAGDDIQGILKAIEESGKRLCAVVLTHGHFDHILAAGAVRAATGAKLYIHEADAPMLEDARRSLYDAMASSVPFTPCEADVRIQTPGDTGVLSLAGFDFQVLNTRGHTQGGICLWDEAARAVFTGDTLFADGYGRTDFPGGSMHEMVESLRRLFALPGDATVYPGHGPSTAMAEAQRRLRE